MQIRPNTRRTIQAKETRDRILELRKQGLTYAAISKEVGVSYDTVSNTISQAMIALSTRTLANAEDLRREDYQKLSLMLEAIWDRVLSGELGAIDRAIRILERRARLMGLDMQQQNAILMALNLNNLTDEQLEQISAGVNPLQVLVSAGIDPATNLNMSAYERSMRESSQHIEAIDAQFTPVEDQEQEQE